MDENKEIRDENLRLRGKLLRPGELSRLRDRLFRTLVRSNYSPEELGKLTWSKRDRALANVRRAVLRELPDDVAAAAARDKVYLAVKSLTREQRAYKIRDGWSNPDAGSGLAPSSARGRKRARQAGPSGPDQGM